MLLTKTGGIFGAMKTIVFTILIPAAFMLSLLLFIWGIVKFISQEGQGKEEGKHIMVWGIVALFVASSIWGIVRFLQGEFNVTNNSAFNLPKFGNFDGGDDPIENPE